MKTILIAHNYNENSFAIISLSLAHYLADEGNRIVFISHKPYFVEDKIIKKETGEIIVCSWPSEKRPTSIKDVIWFANLYLRYKPDTIIGHFVGANITIGISKILSLNNVRTFSYYHTLTQQIKLDQKKSALKSRLLFYRKKIFYKMFCDLIVCPSELAKKDFEKHYNLKKGLVILNPMKDRFKNSPNPNKDEIVISFLGRFVISKGIIELIKAFKIFKQENKLSKIILNIAGSGSQDAIIKQMIQEESSIFYCGALRYDEIDDYLSKSHFTIIPSKIDNLPTVGLESMMNKTPLLISNTTGLTEYMEEGVDCFKFDCDIDSIVKLFKKVEVNFQNQPQLAINARNTYLSKFSMDKYCINFKDEIMR